MTMRKRITVTVEFIEPIQSDVVWSHTETVERDFSDAEDATWCVPDRRDASDEAVQPQPLGVRAGARIVPDMDALRRAASVVTA